MTDAEKQKSRLHPGVGGVVRAVAKAAPPVDDEHLAGKRIMFYANLTYKERGKKSVTDLFECPGTIERVRSANQKKSKVKHKGMELGIGFAFITWSDGTYTTQLLRPGFYGQRRPAGWRLPPDDEDLDLDGDFELDEDEEGGEGGDESGEGSDESGDMGDESDESDGDSDGE